MRKALTIKNLIKLLQEQVKKGRGDCPVGYSIVAWNAKKGCMSGQSLWAMSPDDFIFKDFENAGLGLSLGTFRMRDTLSPADLRKLSKRFTPFTFESAEFNISRAIEHFQERYDTTQTDIVANDPDADPEALRDLMLDIIRADLREMIALYNDIEGLTGEKLELYEEDKNA